MLCVLASTLFALENLFSSVHLLVYRDSAVHDEAPVVYTTNNSATSELSEFSSVSSTNNTSKNQTNLTQAKLYEVCFVTSLVASLKKQVDRPYDSTKMQAENPSFRFYAFTNLPKLNIPGWTLLVRKFPYKRSITQSRWGKFMSWRDNEIIQNCHAVIYMDGTVALKGRADDYRDLALSVRNSECGLAQALHPQSGGIPEEFDRILESKKDIQSNIAKSLEWFQSQPGFQSNITMYQNTFFGKFVHTSCGRV